MTIASLIVAVEANTVKLETGIKGIQGTLDTAGSVASKFGSILAGAFSVAAVTSAIKSYADFTGKLTDLSAKTGIGVEALQRLRFAAEQNGGSLEMVTTAVSKLGANLAGGNKSALGALDALGLSFTQIRDMQPDQAFTTIADAITKIHDPMAQSKLAMDLFGKAGATLLPMMKGNLSETADAANRLGIVLSSEAVAAGDKFGDTMGALSLVGQSVIHQVLEPMIPVLTVVAQWIGEKLPAATRFIIDALQTGFVRTLMEAKSWLQQFLLSVAEGVNSIPLLGQKIGFSAETIKQLRSSASQANDALAIFDTQTKAVGASQTKTAVTVGHLNLNYAEQEETTNKATRAAAKLVAEQEKFRASVQRLDTAQYFVPFKAAVLEVENILEALPSSADIAWNAMTRFKDGVKTASLAAETFGQMLRANLSTELNKIPQTIANAFTGGGGILGALQATLTSVGSTIGGALGLSIGGPLGSSIGSALGSMAGLILNPLKKLFGFGVDEAAKAAAEAAAKANEALLASLQSQVAGFKTDLQGLIGKGAELGYVFDQAGNVVSVKFDKMREVAGKYGTDLASLGPAFQSARLSEAAQTIIDDFWLLVHGGADVGAVLEGMAPQINTLVNDSIKFGTKIPENMAPWIKELLRAGKLTDDSGVKMTDLTKLAFGDPVAAQFLTVQSAILELVKKIDDLITRISSIPDNKNTTIRVTTIHDDIYNSFTGGGGEPDWGGAQAMGGDYYVTRPTLFLAGEAGPERASFSGANRGGSGGGGADNDTVLRAIRDLPRAVKLAVSDALVGV